MATAAITLDVPAFARISASRAPQSAIGAFAGGALPTTVLSSCSARLLPFLSSRDVLPLRATCAEARAAIAAHPFCDLATVVHGHLGPALLPPPPVAGEQQQQQQQQRGAWRACFPRARGANVQNARFGPSYSPHTRRAPVLDADLAHLAGVERLVMSGCERVTDAGVAHLRGVRHLDVSRCPLLTDAAFAHLGGLQSLDMTLCAQPGITDAAFAHLRGLRALAMGGCAQPTITSAAFAPLRGLQTLSMAWCSQPEIGDAAFAHLRGGGLRALDVSFCTQPTITDAAFAQLEGLESLRACGCTQPSLTAAALAPLDGALRALDASFSPALCSDAALAPLVGLRSLLRMEGVRGPWGQRARPPPPPLAAPALAFSGFLLTS